MTGAGKVYLIGAGPGDPDLLTLRAVRALRQSDLVLIDHLVNPEVLAHARPGVEICSVGKRSGRHSVPQAEINRLLIEAARDGRVVARLKGGDPFVFGRGGEEAEALVAAGVAWEVVPGVSAGIAAAAYAGIPILHRERGSSVAFVSGHPGRDPSKVALEADTLVVFMCGSTIAGIARALLVRGRPRPTPVALISSGTTARQVVYRGTLGELARLDSLDIPTPVIAVVGEVAALAAKLRWFGPPPLRAAPPEVNRAVAAAAEARGLFVNAVDDADAASAWLGGVLRRGDVTLAISTAGRSPALAGLLREAFDRLLPADLEAWVELGEALRHRWRADDVPMRDRRPLLLRALQELYP